MPTREEAVRKRNQQRKNEGSSMFQYVDADKLARLGITQYKPKPGDLGILVLPGANPEELPWKEIWIHRRFGIYGRTYLCLERMFGKHCPACKEGLRKAASKDHTEEEVKACRPQRRWLFFVVDVSSKEEERKGMRWFDCPPTVEEGIGELTSTKKSGRFVDVCADADDPYEVWFTRSGQGKNNTEYKGFQLERREGKIKKDWLDTPDFMDVLKIPTREQMEAVIARPMDDDDDDGDIEDRVRGRIEEDDSGSRRGRGRGGRRDDEDEIEEERTSRRGRSRDDDDEPEERSSRRGRSREEDEEPEEERSSRRGRSRDDDDESEDEGRGRGRRGRSRDDDEPEERGSRSNRSRDDDDEPEDEGRGRRRRSGGDDLNDVEEESTESKRGRRGSRRSRDEDNDIDLDEDVPF